MSYPQLPASTGSPKDEPTVRKLRGDEALALQAFYNGLSTEARRLFRPLGWNASLEATAAICSDGEAGLRYDLVLEHGGRIVGWVFIAGLDGDEANFGIGIAEEFVGRGYGRSLTKMVVAHARKLGKKAITLCHMVDNEPARRLYTSCGFEPTGPSKGPEGEDYINMKLTL